jgi:hypothetical protein
MFHTECFDAYVLTATLELVESTLMHLEVRLDHWSNDIIAPGEEEAELIVGNQCSLKNIVPLETSSILTCVDGRWVN